MLAARAKEIVQREVCKGCLPDISTHPVALEPVYRPLGQLDDENSNDIFWIQETPPDKDELIRLQVWISPQQRCDWIRSELWLKQISHIRNRVSFEIAGNCRRISIQLLCNRRDLTVAQTAFSGQFEQCKLTDAGTDIFRNLPSGAWTKTAFCDFFPPPPYSHLFTRPDELKRSVYAPMFTALSQMPPSTTGIYQVVFAPVSSGNNWHQNVEALLDLEYSIKLMGGFSGIHRYAQQTPSGDLRNMAGEMETKSHNDKPFFSAAMRVAVVGAEENAEDMLQSMAVATGLIQHGGRPLRCIRDSDYRIQFSIEQIREIFTDALTYRPGFLLNSWELTSMVHLPAPETTEHITETELNTLETLPAKAEVLFGTPIGTCRYANVNENVCIPPDLRGKHVHLIGRSGTGKSSVMEHMILYGIRQGHGAAVLDPHGRLVQRLLCLLPAEAADRIIYIDPGDPDWVPIWNPFCCRSRLGVSRIADDLISAFKSFVTGWGDRLEHLLRHAIYALLCLPRASLLDVSNILRQKSEESRYLRSEVVKHVDNELAKLFWRNDFDRYGSSDLAPAQHKLSKLLTSGTVSLMLSQNSSSFDLRDIMDSGKILLVNLANIGSEIREILGCFILSLLHLTALGRSGAATESHRPFHIYCDEAHRFITDAMEDLIAETRKFNVSLTLAHQYMSQFNTRKTDALSSVGSTIIFNVDTKDAQHLRKDLQGMVELDDLIKLEVGQAIARIGNNIVRFRTLKPLGIPAKNSRHVIVGHCRSHYCRAASEVKKAIRRRSEQWNKPLPGKARQNNPGKWSDSSALSDHSSNDCDPFKYGIIRKCKTTSKTEP